MFQANNYTNFDMVAKKISIIAIIIFILTV